MKKQLKMIQIISLISVLGFIGGMIYSYLSVGMTSQLASASAGILFAIIPVLPFYTKLNPPFSLTLWVYLFNISSILLGTVLGFYDIFWWWDVYLHTTSGILIAWIGFFLIERLNQTNQVFEKIHRFIVYVFGFSLPLAIGVLWEIFEYTSDQLFGTQLQRDGIHDTMSDLIVATIGALIAVVIYHWLSKRREKGRS